MHPIPPELLGRYSVERDPFSEQDIADYVHSQARDETVQHVERIKREIVIGEPYDIWDVTTDQDRWWVITHPTNLYSQKHFPSLDYTLSFHIGLMMRVRSRSSSLDGNDPTPFDEVIRRQEQAQGRFESAVEAEDYQSVGMLLREALVSVVAALRRRTEIPPEVEQPQAANFIVWTDVLMNQLCGGGSNKELRQHLKNTAKEAWQLANWLTHSRSADKTAAAIAIGSCETVIGHFIMLLERQRVGGTETCPACKSRDIRSHFDVDIGLDGDYFLSCGACDWHSHPDYSTNDDAPHEAPDEVAETVPSVTSSCREHR
ncbi:hypothetical protein SAMN04515620_1012 [Collimonas sp. OK607]|nr:hypothetical protein SAMN04515620_1012 [Collimonas sp. OK607]